MDIIKQTATDRKISVIIDEGNPYISSNIYMPPMSFSVRDSFLESHKMQRTKEFKNRKFKSKKSNSFKHRNLYKPKVFVLDEAYKTMKG